jgi:hypothetical protein
MEMRWISGVSLARPGLISVMMAVTSLSACVQSTPDDTMSFAAPPMQWDHHPEAEVWTESTLVALSTKDPVEERRAFWAGLLSAVARYESTWNPLASGGGGRWIGLMQISPRSANYYGCEATSVGELKDGEANLECAVEIMSTQVAKDGMVAGGGNRGIGRDWAPLRSSEKRAAMAAWTREQPYCKAG